MKKYPNKLLKQLLEKREVEHNGKKYKIHSNIKYDEGMLIYNLIKDNKLNKTLEIGLATGISSIFICQALQDIKSPDSHTALDPYQTEQWKNVGIKNIEKAKLKDKLNVIQEKSEFALPVMANKYASTYDFIFIDGFHTFDNTLIDFFYSNILLKVGGYIVIDDILHKGVAKFVKYLNTNYKNYQHINTDIKTNGVYKKLSEDKREWHFHKNF